MYLTYNVLNNLANNIFKALKTIYESSNSIKITSYTLQVLVIFKSRLLGSLKANTSLTFKQEDLQKSYHVKVLDDGLVAPEHEDDPAAVEADVLHQGRDDRLPTT